MSIDFTPEQEQIRDSVSRLCDDFGDQYWLERDSDGRFPEEFCRAIADHGYMGIAMPQAYGGAGLGITEAAILMQAISQSGAGNGGVSSVSIGIFGLNPVVRYGSEEQKARMLPPIIKRDDIACFGVTEPNTGLDTTRLKTRAVRQGDRYVVHGQKTWISTAQVANKIMLIARTRPEDETERPIDGLSLFYTDLDHDKVEIREIEKMGRKCVDSNQVFFDGLEIPVENRIGEENKGFRYLLHGINPERILIAAGLVGLGRAALHKATQYAKERVVFDRPIGMNQAIQHPLAHSWAELEAANLMAFRAAELYDRGEDCGVLANAAKYLAGEATFNACTNAIMTHGGMGYAKEYHVERYLREALIHRIAPITPHLILCYIAERVLGLPKSY
ncbi:MAG: acyl-CoA dehydrogenase family protein [Alphaproteobacteria bacterium]|jgi:acyl-CoA dehydrogenase|nr:acyl-CoA dehydrogenase [Rhodospirillaceae bacterium]MDP6405729.1 acyl-CoA dehydrogenase family protein [Alphaproteobacteria bacterium]MDP6624680.1 acyl-CoA dehydrogenase family protein [Alphaproteobacteria bacterium]|tara:strand:+ start:1394 stop:2560 length:1167 start_codon:yes stop_codon:yes gene_type:complete